MGLGKYMEAASDIVKALELDYDNKAFRLMVDVADSAFVQINTKLKAKAVTDSNNSYWPYCLGVINEHTKRYTDAITNYLKASKLDEDAVVCVDVGQNQLFACKYLPQKNGRLLTSGGLGTMGYALPAAVGAKVAKPERQTIVICGDGSFQMAMNELAAIRYAQMDIKIVLFRNQVLGLVNQIQNTAPYHGPFGVALDGSPDFAAIAAAYGIPTMLANDEDTLDQVLDQFLAQPGSGLLICEVHPDVTTND